MDNTTGITPVMPVGNGMGEGLGGGLWIFALLILLMIGNGGGIFGTGNNNAIQNDVNRGFDNQNSMANQREILNAVNAGTAQSVAATNQTFHDTLGIVQNRYDELARDISGLAVAQANAMANQNMCCCETKQMIMQNTYDGAMRDAATNANFTAQIQGVKDMIAQNKIEALQAQVSQLQLQAATANVLRFPNAWTFTGGYFPPLQPTTATAAG